MTLGILNPAFVGILAKGIKLTEAVTQQGVAPVAAVAEVFRIDGSNDTTTAFDGTNTASATFELLICTSVSAPIGYSESSGGVGFSYVEFTCDAAGAKDDMAKTGGGGTVSVIQQGVDAVAGAYEIHTITAESTPSGGSWICGGAQAAYNAIPIASGWSFDQALSAGVVTATAGDEEDRSDTALAPNGTNLT